MDMLAQLSSVHANWVGSAVSITLAWLLSQAIAWTYARTHTGLSYSRSMTHALVVAGILAAMLMLAIGNSLARGIGIVGTLALIRFRINLRDPMDMLFVFAAFAAGIAAGTGSHATGVVGTTAFLIAVVVLRASNFGALQQFDGVLRLQLPAASEADTELARVLAKRCRKFALITLREAAQGTKHERIYHISLRKEDDERGLLEAVSAVEGATGISISMQEATVEV